MNHLFFFHSIEGYETLVDKYPQNEMAQQGDFDEIQVRIHRISDALNQLDYHNHDHRVIQSRHYHLVQLFHNQLYRQIKYLIKIKNDIIRFRF
jgi:hypothetical protein